MTIVLAGVCAALMLAALLVLLTTTHLPGLLSSVAVMVLIQLIVVGAFVVPTAGSLVGQAFPVIKLCVVSAIVLRAKRATKPTVRRLGVRPMGLLVGALLLTACAYAILPLDSQLGLVQAPLLARVVNLVQLLTPWLLFYAGKRLAQADESFCIQRLLVRFGLTVSLIAMAAVFTTPVDFWAGLIQKSTDIGGTAIDRASIVDGLQSYFLGKPIPRALAPLGSPLAVAFSLTLPICYLVHKQRRRRQESVTLLICLGALAATQTRSILVACIAVLLATRRGISRIAAAQLGLLALLCIVVLADPISSIQSALSADPSSVGHLSAIAADLQALLRHPLGIGLAQGGRLGRQFGAGSGIGENLFLLIGVELGWAGLAMVLATTGAIAARLVALRRNCGLASPLPEALLSTGLVYVVASLTTEHAIAFESTWMFWMAWGWMEAKSEAGQQAGSQGGSELAKRPQLGVGRDRADGPRLGSSNARQAKHGHLVRPIGRLLPVGPRDS